MNQTAEKLIKYGKDHLSMIELLTLITGNEKASQQTTKESGLNYFKILTFTDGDFIDMGYTPTQAGKLTACLELNRRGLAEEAKRHEQIRSSQDVQDLMKPLFYGLEHEEVYCLYLNRSNKVISRHRVSKGGISGSIIDVRLIIKRAIQLRASSMILSHNHPSGNVEPSEADKRMTAKVKEAAQYFDMQLLDHVIITNTERYSFADNGDI